MIIILIITNLILLATIVTMVVFYYRKIKVKPKVDKAAEIERERKRKAIENIMNYNIDVARRARRE
ncbi:hypothetical protein [Anaerovorax sp. IOR16]|uniref:hypothetical protein n=1 Tax=Anaerovorax sp. IOR16 TaxID=2773458 RepID=UPI0019D2261A|nr:hypothetical protein [Anaerovorax sp. IOR16]